MHAARRTIVQKFNKTGSCRFLKESRDTKTKWKSVVGLEVHAKIESDSKLFSGSGTAFGAPLNSSVSLFDAAIPGTLPVLNKACVELGVKTALALGCTVNRVSMFDRKHYFYADLPAGYQITQQRAPLANDGTLKFPVIAAGGAKKPYFKTVRLHQLQLEQDSGKSLHDDVAGRSLVDLNRAGVPLMELVFDPDLEDGEEAASLVKELILILKCIGSCSCRMEEGALRVDANVSLHMPNTPLGTRTEIKNIGSVRNVAQAISYEIERQRVLLDANKTIQNETRTWDAIAKKTIAMRDKEVQQDYRFMPEPNLPPLHLAVDETADIKGDAIKVFDLKNAIPMLPEKKRQELAEKFGLSQEIAIILVNEQILLNYFNRIMASNREIVAKTVANFLINDLLTFCNKADIAVEDCAITSEQFIELFELLKSQTISVQSARMLLEEMHLDPSKSPAQICDEKNWKQINDVEIIETLCRECIANNRKTVDLYLNGKEKVFYALVGEIAKKSEQRANMSLVVDKLKQLLKAMKQNS